MKLIFIWFIVDYSIISTIDHSLRPNPDNKLLESVARACWVHDLWAALFWVTRACRERVDLQCSRARTTWEERQRCGHPGGARCQRGAGAGAVNVAWRDTGAQERKHKQVHQKSVKLFNFFKFSSSRFCSSVKETQTVLLLVNSYSLTFILTFCSE